MNILTRNKLLAMVMLLMFALSATACGGSNEVDKLLDEYEKFVVKCEDLAKQDNVSMEDAQKFMNEATEFSQNAQKNFSADTKMSDAQTKRYQELSNRLMKAVQTIQTKN